MFSVKLYYEETEVTDLVIPMAWFSHVNLSKFASNSNTSVVTSDYELHLDMSLSYYASKYIIRAVA